MKPVDELRHVLYGLNSDEEFKGFHLISYNVYCQDNAEQVLKNCQKILEIILRQCEKEIWPAENEWYQLLPNWFIVKSASEKTIEEEEEYNAQMNVLSINERYIALQNESWSVMDFVSWFEPGENVSNERYWSWWNAIIKSPELLVVTVEIMDFPFPSGCLFWLFRACGASRVEKKKIK